jgi:hypothetical protein
MVVQERKKEIVKEKEKWNTEENPIKNKERKSEFNTKMMATKNFLNKMKGTIERT